MFYEDYSSQCMENRLQEGKERHRRKSQGTFSNPSEKWCLGSDGDSRDGENLLNSGYIPKREPILLDGSDIGCEGEKGVGDDQTS